MSMSTAGARGDKCVATSATTHQDMKQPKQLSTDVRPQQLSAKLRARLRADEEAAARSISIANQEQSPFLQLPAELRVRIYEFVLGGNVVAPAYIRKTEVTPGRPARYSAEPAVLYTLRGLIFSCRAIQMETELLLYSANTFRDYDYFDWTQWLQVLDMRKRAAIKTIQIDYPCSLRSPAELTHFDKLLKLRSITVRQSADSLKFGRPMLQAIRDIQNYAQARKWKVKVEGKRCKCYNCQILDQITRGW